MSEHRFNKGDRVRYIPGHAAGDALHPDCEAGEVAGLSEHEADLLFVRFDGDPTPKSCYADMLVPEPLVQAVERQQQYDANIATADAVGGVLAGSLPHPAPVDPPNFTRHVEPEPAKPKPNVVQRMVTVRMAAHQHELLKVQAQAQGISLNTHCMRCLGFESPFETDGQPRGRKLYERHPPREDAHASDAIDAAFIMAVLPTTRSYEKVRRGEYSGRWGTMVWEIGEVGYLMVFANAQCIDDWHEMTRSEFRRLAHALGIKLVEVERAAEEPEQAEKAPEGQTLGPHAGSSCFS